MKLTGRCLAVVVAFVNAWERCMHLHRGGWRHLLWGVLPRG
jgi:hypothetical protein